MVEKNIVAKKPSPAKQNAEIENLGMGNSTQRAAPLALWWYAKAFHTAGVAAPPCEHRFEPARYYLICHSIELALKAYLAVKGETLLDLSGRKLGHVLNNLLVAAEEKGLRGKVALTDVHCAEIRSASDYYLGKVFEYPAIAEAIPGGYPKLPSLEVLTEAAEILVRTLELPCKEAFD
jgi:hypothetical protein